MEDLTDWDYEKLYAVIESELPCSVVAILALIQELDDFDLISEVEDEESMGEYYGEACGVFNALPEMVQRYFGYMAYGRDIHLEGRGIFASFG